MSRWQGQDIRELLVLASVSCKEHAREVCCFVHNGKLKELENGEFAELAAIGVQGIQEWLATV